MWGTAGQNDVSARQDTGGILYGEEAEANILHLSEPNRKSNERRSQMKGKMYGIGVLTMVISGASLADHITCGVDAFPLSAVFFGLGFVLVCMSYGKENNRRR